jgi:hypothetical protein
MRWLWFVLACLPVQVAALSCVEPSVQRTFLSVADAAPAYVIVHGTIEYDLSAWPDRDSTAKEQPTEFIPARVTGQSLSSSGFKTDFTAPVTLVSYCLGPWCGGAASGGDYLMFLRKTETGYEQDIAPCADKIFTNPTKAHLRAVRRCFNGRPCPSTNILETILPNNE